MQRAGLDAGKVASATIIFPSNNTAKNWIAVCIRAGAMNEVLSVSDTAGNSYREAFQSNQSGDGDTFALFYAENIVGGPNAVTVRMSVSETLRIAVLEYSGIATLGSLDGAAVAQGSSASPNSGKARTTANGDLVIGVIMTSDSEAFTAGPGYSLEAEVPAEPGTKLLTEAEVQASAGTISAGASLGATDPWGAGVAAFKAATIESLQVAPTSATFSNVPVGTTNSQTIQVTNPGSTNAVVSGATLQGAGFATSGLNTPFTLGAGTKSTFSVSFSPTSTGSVGGVLALSVSGGSGNTTIPLVGTAVAATSTLSPNPASISFGSVAVNGSATVIASVTNTGNSSVTVSSVTVSGVGFSFDGPTSGTLVAGQTATAVISFAPQTAGRVAGSVTIVSNAKNGSTLTIPMTGVGAEQQTAVLSWSASTSSGVVGYNVYRSTVSGGPYGKIVGAPVGGMSYSDGTIQTGTSYYYVVTSVGSNGEESAYSNQISVAIP